MTSAFQCCMFCILLVVLEPLLACGGTLPQQEAKQDIKVRCQEMFDSEIKQMQEHYNYSLQNQIEQMAEYYDSSINYTLAILNKCDKKQHLCKYIVPIILNARAFNSNPAGEKLCDKHKKDYIEILERFNDICVDTPGYIEMLGILYVECHKWDKGILNLSKAWESKEKLGLPGIPCLYLARAYYHSGQFDKAKEFYSACPPTEPGACPQACMTEFEVCFEQEIIRFPDLSIDCAKSTESGPAKAGK